MTEKPPTRAATPACLAPTGGRPLKPVLGQSLFSTVLLFGQDVLGFQSWSCRQLASLILEIGGGIDETRSDLWITGAHGHFEEGHRCLAAVIVLLWHMTHF